MNKNDEAPVFTVNEYYGSVTEELDGSPVFVFQVQTINVSRVTGTVSVHLHCCKGSSDVVTVQFKML